MALEESSIKTKRCWFFSKLWKCQWVSSWQPCNSALIKPFNYNIAILCINLSYCTTTCEINEYKILKSSTRVYDETWNRTSTDDQYLCTVKTDQQAKLFFLTGLSLNFFYSITFFTGRKCYKREVWLILRCRLEPSFLPPFPSFPHDGLLGWIWSRGDQKKVNVILLMKSSQRIQTKFRLHFSSSTNEASEHLSRKILVYYMEKILHFSRSISRLM